MNKLKYYAGIQLSWNGMQAKLPEVLPAVKQKERPILLLRKVIVSPPQSVYLQK